MLEAFQFHNWYQVILFLFASVDQNTVGRHTYARSYYVYECDKFLVYSINPRGPFIYSSLKFEGKEHSEGHQDVAAWGTHVHEHACTGRSMAIEYT